MEEMETALDVNWKVLMILMMELTIWDYKHLALISESILFEKLFTQHFYVKKFLYPTHFYSLPTPLYIMNGPSQRNIPRPKESIYVVSKA